MPWGADLPTHQFTPRDGDVLHADGTVSRRGLRYGCSCDLEPGEEPTGCDLTEGYAYGCDLVLLDSGRSRRSPFTCEYWQPAAQEE